MGMYTALSLGVELRKDVPPQVIELLRYMVGDSKNPPWLSLVNHDAANERHPFFSCPRWGFMLRCDSYYFDWDTRFTLRHDAIANAYFLSGVCNLENYDQEIENFLDWLNPFIAESVDGYIGWTMYEEVEFPTILMLKRELVKIDVEELIGMLGNANTLIEQLMPGVGNCVIDVAKLNNFFSYIDSLKKDNLI